jgi:transcriptional regulator with XRE-family HTH domain
VIQTPTKRLRKPGTQPLYQLRRVREQRGLSLKELAEKAGLAKDTVWRLDTVQREAEPKTRRKLASALGVGIRDLTRPPDEEADDG